MSWRPGNPSLIHFTLSFMRAARESTLCPSRQLATGVLYVTSRQGIITSAGGTFKLELEAFLHYSVEVRWWASLSLAHWNARIEHSRQSCHFYPRFYHPWAHHDFFGRRSRGRPLAHIGHTYFEHLSTFVPPRPPLHRSTCQLTSTMIFLNRPWSTLGSESQWLWCTGQACWRGK